MRRTTKNQLHQPAKAERSRSAKRHPDTYTVGRSLPSSALPQPTGKAEPLPPKRSRKRWLWLLLLVPLCCVLAVVAWNVHNYSQAAQKLFGSSNVLSALVPSPLQGAERGRVNILLVGYSADDPGHGGATLTDSLMIVSLSNTGGKSYMLSIPRDLYVAIPGYGRAKINEAYQAGGMAALEQTIADHLGVPIDYYAIVNYAAVRDTTNAVDGINVSIASTDPRGIYDPNFQPIEGGPLRLANGTHHVDGQTALKLVRARGAAGGYGLAQSDFDRTKNQQAVLLGLKEAVTPKLLLDPRQNSPLLMAVAEHVRTDIALSEVVPLYRLWNTLPPSGLSTVTLREIGGRTLLRGHTTPSGQSALVPAAGITDYSDIRANIERLNQ